MTINHNDEGISAVMGTILMVVIVTVLASITALSMFIYLQNVNNTYLISLTMNQVDLTTIQITNHGGPNINDLDSSVTSPFIVYVDTVVTAPNPPTQLTASVGSYANYPAHKGQHVEVVGLFQGNKKGIIYDGTA